jgi:hypothetical protein
VFARVAAALLEGVFGFDKAAQAVGQHPLFFAVGEIHACRPFA